MAFIEGIRILDFLCMTVSAVYTTCSSLSVLDDSDSTNTDSFVSCEEELPEQEFRRVSHTDNHRWCCMCGFYRAAPEAPCPGCARISNAKELLEPSP